MPSALPAGYGPGDVGVNRHLYVGFVDGPPGHIYVVGSGWLRPGDSGGPTWGTSWAHFNTALVEVVAMKRVGYNVRVVGIAKRTAGSSAIIMTLPADCRPPRALNRWAAINGVAAQVQVDPNGDVTLAGTYVNNQYVQLDFTFDTDALSA